MKKIKIILLSFFLLFPLFTKADTIKYDIDHYYINADILENGDLKVTELIVLNGNFNGYVREIAFKNSQLNEDGYVANAIYNAHDIKMLNVSAKKIDSVSFETMNDSDFNNLRLGQASNYGYLEKNVTNGRSYKMYFKANNESVAFKLEYLIKDVVVLHKDVSELYWTFIGSEYEDDIRDLQIKVNLPKMDSSDNFRIWAHGDIAGEIQPFENKYLLASIPKLDAHNAVDVRTTFDVSLLNESLVNKKTEDIALEEIIEVETERAEKQNKKRKKMKILYYSCFGISIFYLITLIIIWIYVYFKYNREYKSAFKNEYNREFIDDYNVEVVDYLINKKITSNAMSASIMNLIYKKAIQVEEIPTEKKQKEYKFILLDLEKGNETEKYLMNFLFQKVGNDDTFTTKELQDYAKGNATCEKFAVSYTAWKKKVTEDGRKQNFFEKNGKPIGISICCLLFSIFISILTSAFHIVFLLPYLNTFFSILFLFNTCFSFKRTKKGNEDYVQWMAFKKFLNDFGTFDTKELPEIALWERYMVYATVFGIADKVSKVMNVKIKEMENAGIFVGNYTPTFSDWYVFNSITNSVSNSIHSNVSAITASRANSSSSSGSGFGGGFSSGGGFGGGGGGGHGF